MAPSTTPPMDFVLFPHGHTSSFATQEAIHTMEDRTRAPLPVLMAPYSSKPTSTDSVRSCRSSPSGSRQQEQQLSKKRPQRSQSKCSGKAASVEEASFSEQRRVHRSMSMDPEPEFSVTQFPSPDCPRRTSAMSLSNSGRRRNSRVPPAVPDPPRSQRLPTPELSDVDEDNNFESLQHSYSKMDAQMAAASQYITRARR